MARRSPQTEGDAVAVTERRVRANLLLGAVWIAFALIVTFVYFQWRDERVLRIARTLTPAEIGREIANGRAFTVLALVGGLVTLLLVLYLIVTRLLRAMLDAERRLEKLATRDALTGLWNRRIGLSRLREEIVRSDREGRPLSVLMVDLDHFKKVNDSLGHAVGDATLVAVAYALNSEARSYDVVVRMGGEEFLVLLPGTDEREGERVAERVRVRVSRTTPVAVPQLPRAVTASVGVAAHTPGASEDADLLLARADRAMYAAKKRGRNRVMVA